MSDLTVTYTTWVGLNAKSLSRTVTEPWAKFVDKFSQKRPYRGQWNHPGWSGATFSKSHRCDENVTSITMLVLDFDHDYRIDDARRDFAGLLGLLHTSKSHTDNEHAFRVILPLSRPVTADEYAELWAWAEWKSGAKLDIACKDASRFWYQPGVPSDDSTFLAEELTGDLLAVDEIIAEWLANPARVVPVAVEALPIQHGTSQKQPNLSSGAKTGTSDYRGRGILFAAFENRNWIRKEIDSEKCAAVCPWESSHTAGKGSESSTVLYFAKPGHEIGYLHCSHAHCAGRTADDVLALFTQDELNEARRVEGLPAFRAPKANVRELVPPPDDGWTPTDDDDPRAPPKARAMAAALASVVGLTPEDFPSGTSFDVPESFDRKQPAMIDLHRFALTDLGNAERLVRDHGANLRYCSPKKKWYVWSGKYWQQDETGELVRLAKSTARSIYAEAAEIDDDDRRKAVTKHALASERAPRITAMIELAQSEPGIPVLPSDLDADPWKFCCTNGTIDLRTGALLPHCREDLITRFSAVQYDPKAESELWEIYLDSATNRDKELEAYIRRAVGYSLQGTVTERKFFFVFGPPGGTKSTFIETIGAAFGGYHQPADSETWLLQNNIGGNRGDLVRLAGARLVTSVEVRKEARFDEALIKRITGGDALTAAAKYENEVTFTPALTLWLAANDPPAIRDDDEGMWARVCRIPFTHALSADQQDCTMRERLRAPEVLSAVLAWAVRGCVEWQTSGLGSCRAVAASVAEYRVSMDRAAGFLEGECVFAPGMRVLAGILRKAYVGWCDEASVKPLSPKDFAKRLTDRGCTNDKNSRGDRFWVGIRLVEELFDRTSGATASTAPVSGNSPREKNMADFTGSDAVKCRGAVAGSQLDFGDYEDEERKAIQS